MKKLRVRKSGIPGSGPHPSTDSRFHCSLGGCCRVGLCFLLQSPARTTELAPHSCSGQAGEEQRQMPCPLFQQLWERFSAKESWKTNWFRVTYWLNHLLTVGTLASSYSFETGIIPALHIFISWELLGFFKLKKKKFKTCCKLWSLQMQTFIFCSQGFPGPQHGKASYKLVTEMNLPFGDRNSPESLSWKKVLFVSASRDLSETHWKS